MLSLTRVKFQSPGTRFNHAACSRGLFSPYSEHRAHLQSGNTDRRYTDSTRCPGYCHARSFGRVTCSVKNARAILLLVVLPVPLFAVNKFPRNIIFRRSFGTPRVEMCCAATRLASERRVNSRGPLCTVLSLNYCTSWDWRRDCTWQCCWRSSFLLRQQWLPEKRGMDMSRLNR